MHKLDIQFIYISFSVSHLSYIWLTEETMHLIDAAELMSRHIHIHTSFVLDYNFEKSFVNNL